MLLLKKNINIHLARSCKDFRRYDFDRQVGSFINSASSLPTELCSFLYKRVIVRDLVLLKMVHIHESFSSMETVISERKVITLKDTLKAFDDFKNKQQRSVWNHVFWYVYSESLFSIVYIEIKLKCLYKFPSDKINGSRKALFFLSRSPTHNSFTFNLRFFYDEAQGSSL